RNIFPEPCGYVAPSTRGSRLAGAGCRAGRQGVRKCPHAETLIKGRHMVLEDGYTKRIVLEFLIKKLEEGDGELLLRGGVAPELLEALRGRPAHDLMRVAEMKQTEIHVQ